MNIFQKKSILIIATLLLISIITGCSSSRHVPSGSYLLDKIQLQINDSTHTIEKTEMMSYLRQTPNHKMLWSMKFRLGVYNMSGKDSTKWWNRWIRKLGEAPVIYDSLLTEEGVKQLQKALVNKGYLEAEVYADTIRNDKKKKIKVDYHLNPGDPHIIENISYVFPDSIFREIILKDSFKFVVRRGDNLDRSQLDTQREIITGILRENGYYGFTKDFITFTADTTQGSKKTDLTMIVNPPTKNGQSSLVKSHELFRIRNVYVITDYQPGTELTTEEIINGSRQETYKGLDIVYNGKQYLRPQAIFENCYLRPGELYKLSDVEKTYRAFSRFSILNFINVKFQPIGSLGEDEILDAYVLLTPGKSQSVSFELEGTNSEGDLGVAAGVTYAHRNIGKGSETLSVKFRGAYESLSGDLEGLLNDRYMEYSADVGLSFPKFKAPFLTERFKRRVNASTELNLSLSYQERPEYTRVISNAGWSYRWVHNRNHNIYLFTPIDINYVYLPKSTYDFINQIAPDNPLLRYSYEDHFIMRLGFSFYHSNKKDELPWSRSVQQNIYTIRANAEIAGNFLYLLSCIFKPHRDISKNPYKILGIYYAQYFRINSDFSFIHIFDVRNSLAFHAGFGIGYPYGNSNILPFEKRFYGGGANGVRGWDVRTLGPGTYPNSNSVSDFINQCGDIRFILSAEMRTKLFWVFELAAFIDAGNIWTIHSYPNQPGGMFHFNTFYKQLAASYGLGLRLDFTYFLLRFDMGVKAHNPALGAVEWPLIHPNWHRDTSFHFSIGYPF